jgi:HD-GYP domain-containing protein (c-di-GMP phosphodiesterase class II)
MMLENNATVLETSTEPKARSRSSPSLAQTESLAIILREEFGESFTFHDAATGEAIHDAGSGGSFSTSSGCDPEQIKNWAATGYAQVTHLRDREYQLVLPLSLKDVPPLVGVVILNGFARSQAEAGREQSQLQKWAQSVCDRLMMTTSVPVQHRKGIDPEGASKIAWEAIGTLEQLTRRLRVHKDGEKNQKRILQAAAALLRVKAVLWVPERADAGVVAWGDSGLSPWDCRQFAHRLAKNPELGKTGFLLLNESQDTNWRACFAHITNMLVLAIRDHGTPGLLIAINKQSAAHESSLDKQSDQDDPESKTSLPRSLEPASTAPFRRRDVAVLTPFAALFGLIAGAIGRYHDLNELLVGLARSLTASIDAKDTYTFGHSERVGRVAVELGRELGLKSDEVSDLYLAGLLHDVGKIGIRDAVLSKPERLTEEEMKHVQQHVTIGHSILVDLHPIRHLLPGVLYHHERYDGNGYPEGLKGEAIPLIARILAVADAYDAMSTNRPYRTAMTLDQVESILGRGAGTQWDKRIVEAFMRCRLKIHAIRQRGIGESLRQAIHGALRQDDSSRLNSVL